MTVCLSSPSHTHPARRHHGFACAWLILFVLMGAWHSLAHALEVNKETNYLVDQWTVDSGLPINGINRLAFDETGYLWLATYDGLVRFDGMHFQTFNSSNSQGIDTNRLTELFAGKDQVIWVGDERARFYWFKDGTFHPAQKSNGDDLAAATCAYQTRAKTLFFCTEEGLFTSNEQQVFEAHKIPKLKGIPTVVFEDDNACLWVGSDAGNVMKSCHDQDEEIIHLSDQQAPIRINVFDTNNQDTYIGTSHGLYQQQNQQWQLIEGTADLQIIRFAALPDGTFFVRSQNGVYRINPSDAQRTRIPEVNVGHTGNLKFTHPDGSTWLTTIDRVLRDDQELLHTQCGALDIEFDQMGTVWVAGACDGLIRLTKSELTMLTQNTGGKPVYGVAQTKDGTIWSSEKNTVVAYRPDGSIELLDTKPNDSQPQKHASNGIEANIMRTLYVDAKDHVWVGQTGVCQIQGASCVIPPDMPDVLRKNFVFSIFNDHQGDLWVGTSNMLWRKRNDRWEKVPLRALVGLPSHTEQGDLTVRGAIFTQPNMLWLATNNYGLVRKRNEFWQAFGTNDGLSGLAIRDLHQDKHGWLWVVTESRGLCVTQTPEADQPEFACLSRKQGLHTESLHRLLEDEHEHFWLNSNSGIFWVKRQELVEVLTGKLPRMSPRIYGKRDGLSNAEGNGGVHQAGIILKDGRLAFPTQGGLAIFDPSKEQRTTQKPTTALEQIQLPDGRTLAIEKDVHLPLGQRTFLLKFTALSANLVDPAHFEYRMLPNQPTWERIGAEHTMRVTNLVAGTHRIELKAYNPSDNLTGDVASVNIHVPAQPWENRLIQAAALLSLFAMVVLWLWQRDQSIKQRAKSLEQRVEKRTEALFKQTKKTEQALAKVSQQREEIEQLSTAKSKFFANASHELRTPLAVMLAPLQDALEGTPIPPERMKAMVRNGHRLERLIEHMLDLERLDTNNFPLHPMVMDMNHVIHEAVQLFQPVANAQDINLTHSSESDDLLIHADPDQMARIIANLLSNAIKFTPKNGHIKLRSFTHKKRMMLWVEDSGTGVPDEWKERIFNRFEQIANDTNRSREGAGLGLAMCREIAQLHHGSLHVEDADIGGACFILNLPLHAQRSAPSAHPETNIKQAVSKHVQAAQKLYVKPSKKTSTKHKTGTRPDLSQKNILVAEDNPDLRAYIHDILSTDFNVVTAEDGAMAFRMARKYLPDLIISDIMMPNLDGFGLVKKLRQHQTLKSIPLIFLTARASDVDEIDALNMGADQYLRKPFDRNVLLAHVRAALHSMQRLKEHYQRLAAQQPPVPPSDEPTDEQDKQTNPPYIVTQAIAWIDQHMHEPSINAANVAEALNTSRATLDRQFKAHHSTSFISYLKHHRLLRAHKLLEEQQGSVSEIAYACGFTSLSSFSRAYRKEYGKAPSIA